MTSEPDSDEAAVTAQDETKWSFLRRLIVAIAERQKKAAEVVKQRRRAASDDPRVRPG
jgi:hypothetical protein